MKRFTNAKQETYHHSAITEFSDISHLISTGVAKGYSSNKYSWVSDFLFKHRTNYSINPHIGYIGFVSDRNTMEQEYGNVSRLYNAYTFLSEYERAILPPHCFEMSTKQYFRVGQKFSEYDTIEYINASNLYQPDVVENPSAFDIATTYNIRNGHYRKPAFYAVGYKLDMGIYREIEPHYQYYEQYLWALPKMIKTETSQILGRSVFKYNVGEDGFTFKLLPYLFDMVGNDGLAIINTYPPQSAKRLFDYKVLVDNPDLYYFNEVLGKWEISHNNINAGSGKYYPYIGFVQCFDEYWNWDTPYKTTESRHGNITFYPEITQNGVLEPAKTVIQWPYLSSRLLLVDPGAAVFNSGIHLGDADDQSRVVYNICKHMTEWDAVTSRYIVRKKDPHDEGYYLHGLDVDTERNRRYSAVVMTEPYFVTSPIANGQIAHASFVNYQGLPIKRDQYNLILSNPQAYLKIKAPLSVIRELDRHLNLVEYNTDVINTLTIENPRTSAALSHLLSDAEPYSDFGGDSVAFLYRQEMCLDDLIGIIGGMESTDGNHREFFITSFGPQAPKYSNDKMKVCGLGFSCETNIGQDGEVLSTQTERLHIYCTNFSHINAPQPGDSNFERIENESKEFLDDSSYVTTVEEHEQFKPMIKWPGINGYIKILRRNPHFKVKRAHDGDYEVIYNVEFPYCPGSFIERRSMNFTDDHPSLPVHILYKQNYINAGSWAVTGDDRYDDTNDRYVPHGDDSFTLHQLLRQKPLQYNFVSIGGGYYTQYVDTITTLDKSNYHNEIIQYPDHAAWSKMDPKLLSLKKSVGIELGTGFDFRRHGFYNIEFSETASTYQQLMVWFASDLKLMALVDNRQWNFDSNKYTSFIGRENPAYICEMDISTLFEDFRTYQAQHGSIPDVKRWLYGYFSGFAHMVTTIEEAEATRSETTLPEGANVLATQDAESNIVVEIWDQESDVGNGQKGNWRPLSAISSDTGKIAGELIIDNMFVWNDEKILGDDPDVEFSDIYKFYLGYAGVTPIGFPVDFDTDLLHEKSNLVLSDGYHNKNYHIVYIKKGPIVVLPDLLQLYEVYARPLSGGDTLFIEGESMFSPSNWPDSGPISVHKPQKRISKNPNFNIFTDIPSPTITTESVTRHIDIKSEEGTNGIPDLTRYVNGDNKIFFRARVCKYNNYPITYLNEDESEIQYIGEIASDEWVNFPWGNGLVFDSAFSWGKINVYERAKKFGATYFKCASK